MHSPTELLAILEEATPRLVAYAARRLRRVGWAEGDDDIPSAVQAEEACANAIVSFLDGTRSWPEDVGVETLLYGIIKSQIFHARHSGVQETTPIEDAPELAAPPSRRDDAIDGWRLLSAIGQVLAPDRETSALFDAMRDDNTTPAMQAAALEWTAERVKAAHVKMGRRLDAAGLKYGDDDERRDRSPRAAPAPRRGARRGAAG